MPSSPPVDAVARGTLEHLDDHKLVLSLPGSDYRIELVPTVPAAGITTPLGRRITGTVHADAQRMHPAVAGGRFIEPVYGPPRIVAGRIAAVDEASQRVLVQTALPMWVTWQEGQDTSILQVGQMVNCHVRSGARFEPG